MSAALGVMCRDVYDEECETSPAEQLSSESNHITVAIFSIWCLPGLNSHFSLNHSYQMLTF